jgi:hypothetical protein
MTNARKLVLAALAAALLAGCGTQAKTKPSKAEPVKSPPPATGALPSSPALESKIVALPFRLDLTFSDKALAQLRETGADLGVSADYYGQPKDPNQPGLESELGVWLGAEMETIDPAKTSVTFKGQIDAAQVAREVVGDARVKVIVFPIRAFGAQVTCTEFDEYLSIAVETGGTVNCTLVGE